MKIFLSSTAYDLFDLRSIAIDVLISRGHEVLHHEMPTFVGRRGLHSHDACIMSVDDADAVLCLIDRRYGGRYAGSAMNFQPQAVTYRRRNADGSKTINTHTVNQNELSITWCELIRAYSKKKHIVTFCRSRTLDEKETCRRNDRNTFVPSYVEVIDVFDLLDWITKRPIDNWITPFADAVDFRIKLEKWLEGLEQYAVPPTSPVTIQNASRRVVIVEGPRDAEVIRTILSRLRLPAPWDITVTGGRRTMPLIAKKFSEESDEPAAFVIVVDGDAATTDSITDQLRSALASVPQDRYEIIAVSPGLEAWVFEALASLDDLNREVLIAETITANLHGRDKAWRLGVELLGLRLEELARRMSSLRQFIDAMVRLSGE